MFNKPLNLQIQELIKIIYRNPNIKEILDDDPFPNINEWYLGAGCICQSVWNYLSGVEITRGIKDYDLVYYSSELSAKSEKKEQERLKVKFAHLPIDLEIINEARVHLWFEEDFGKKIEPYTSCEDSINNWPTTATAIGVRKVSGQVHVYAPYGLNDLFGMIVRPNKIQVPREVYEKKAQRWITQWPKLKIIPWS